MAASPAEAKAENLSRLGASTSAAKAGLFSILTAGLKALLRPLVPRSPIYAPMFILHAAASRDQPTARVALGSTLPAGRATPWPGQHRLIPADRAELPDTR